MTLLYLMLMSADGGTHEATAYANHEGTLLPPGRWRVVDNFGIMLDRVMDVEDMPDHWREQLHKSGEFGKRLEE
jgi:hypothetical protein